jgi:hypothetical protein
MANAKTINTTFTINTEIETAFRDWTGDTIKSDLAKTKRVDVFRAAGWTSAHFISPKSAGSAASDESWAFAKASVNKGMPAKAQALMDMSAKAAGDKTVNGQPRAYWMRQANAVLSDIKKQLKLREDIAADIANGKQGADARTVTPEQKVCELLNDCVKRIQKAESFTSSMELDDVVKCLKGLVKAIG